MEAAVVSEEEVGEFSGDNLFGVAKGVKEAVGEEFDGGAMYLAGTQ